MGDCGTVRDSQQGRMMAEYQVTRQKSLPEPTYRHPDTEEVAGSQLGSHPDGQLAREPDEDEPPPLMRPKVTDRSERAWTAARVPTDQEARDDYAAPPWDLCVSLGLPAWPRQAPRHR